ncbi:MAG: YdeI/OmpD-associated family protein [Gemmatimonadales bacterium]
MILERFTARVRIAGINPYVEVLRAGSGALGAAPKHPVLVRVRKAGAQGNPKSRNPAQAARLRAIGRLGARGWYRTTIVRFGRSKRLYLDQWMRAEAGVRVGDTVEVVVRPDRGARELALPAPLAAALDGNSRARSAWERLAPSRRREMWTSSGSETARSRKSSPT